MGSRFTSSGAAGSSGSAPKFEQASGIQVADVTQFTMGNFNVNNTTNNINNFRDQSRSPDEVKNAFIDSLEFEGMNERHDNIEDNTTNTCQWLLKTSDWSEWQTSFATRKHRRLFWIKGQPGAGKSTYMKFAVRHARAGETFRGNVILAHFFDARAPNELSKSVEGMYRTILTQLVNGLPSDIVLEMARSRRTDIKGGWKLGTLSTLFKDIIRNHITRPVTCFIDALDECNEQQVQNMVHSFRDLAEEETHGLQFRACLSSRYYPNVAVTDGTAIEFRLDQQPGHFMDIETYIEKYLQVSGSRIAALAHGKVRQKARGVFIWCRLAIDILNQEYREGGLTQEEVLNGKLNTIPADLHRLFSSILGLQEEAHMESNAHAMDSTTLCMQWALFSQDRDTGPLWWALQRTSQPRASTAALEAQYQSHNRETMKRYILSFSKGLLEVAEPRHRDRRRFGSVQVIHESVRDFLLTGGLALLMGTQSSTEKDRDGGESEVTAKSHERLKMIAFDEGFRHHDEIFAEMSDNTPDPVVARQNLQRTKPLLLYSSFSVHHAREAFREFGIDQAHFLKMLGEQDSLDRQWKLRTLISRRKKPLTGSLTDLLIYENAAFLLRTHFSQPRERCPSERPTLHYCFNRHDMVSPETIRAMVDINLNWHKEAKSPRHDALKRLADQVDYMDPKPPPHIHIQSATRAEKMLFQRKIYPGLSIFFLGALLPSSPEVEEVVLSWERRNRENPATFSSLASFMLLALQHIAPSEARQILDLGELLLFAAGVGDEGLARLLLDKFDTSCNVQGRKGETPLHCAVLNGKVPVVRLLLSRADINPGVADLRGETAFHDASQRGLTAVVEELVASDKVDINSKDEFGNTALHLATYADRHEIIRILLASEKIDVNSKDFFGNTALHLASSYHRHDIIRILLASRKIDVNARNDCNDTPIGIACREGEWRLAILLFKAAGS